MTVSLERAAYSGRSLRLAEGRWGVALLAQGPIAALPGVLFNLVATRLAARGGAGVRVFRVLAVELWTTLYVFLHESTLPPPGNKNRPFLAS